MDWTVIWLTTVGVLMIREQITYNIEMACIRRCSELADKAIHEDKPWQTYYEKMGERSYQGILFDLTAWTPKQARPWLFD